MMKAILVCLMAAWCISTAFGVDGFGGYATGGAGGPTVTVTNEADLFRYISATTPGPYIVQVQGTITVTISDGLRMSAKKTLRGVGVNPTLVGNLNFKNRDSNMIIEHMNFTNPRAGSAYDGISLKQELNNILITKCSFYDCGDGQLDISNETDNVTVSWCKFYYTPSAPDPGHTFSTLVGSSDKQIEDSDNLRVTYHHNWWTTGVKERMPRVRYGQVHVYNNYYSDLVAGGYCIGVGCGSRIRVENNYFNAVPMPWKNYYTEAPTYPVGHIGWNTGNVYYNCTQPTWATNEYATIFTPPYDYTLDDAADVPAMVQAYAGAGTPDLPHWFFTYYGDFDRSGTVNMADLATFVGYWLETDNIADADYYPNGRVDMAEFALFAENWL